MLKNKTRKVLLSHEIVEESKKEDAEITHFNIVQVIYRRMEFHLPTFALDVKISELNGKFWKSRPSEKKCCESSGRGLFSKGYFEHYSVNIS